MGLKTLLAAALFLACAQHVDAAVRAAVLEQRVDLQGCSIAVSPVVSGNIFYDVGRIDGVNVSFVNAGSAPLNSVTFIVHYNGETQTVTDRGTFSPGIRIDHQLGALQSEPYAGRDVTCEVSTFPLRPV